MSVKVYENLGQVLEDIETGLIIDGDVLTNLDTNERVVLKDGNLHFLTMGGYVSNEVPLVRGMIQARWSVEEREFEEVSIAEAFEHVVNGNKIFIKTPIDSNTVENVSDLLQEVLDPSLVKLVESGEASLYVSIDDVASSKYARKTTETEAWAILMDRTFFDFTAEELSEKYGISLRNVYYILDGTHYKDVHDRFNQLVETGELYVGN